MNKTNTRLASALSLAQKESENPEFSEMVRGWYRSAAAKLQAPKPDATLVQRVLSNPKSREEITASALQPA